MDMEGNLNEAIAKAYADTKLAAAIASRASLVPGASDQLARLWRDDFTVKVGEDGRPALVARSGRAVDEEIRNRLAVAEFGHFHASGGRVGAGIARESLARPTSPSSSSPGSPMAVPAFESGRGRSTAGELLIMAVREQLATRRAEGDPLGGYRLGGR